MKLLKISLIIFIGLLSFTAMVSGQTYKNFNIKIYDSIIVTANKLSNLDFNPSDNIYTAIDTYSRDVLIFTTKGKTKYQFNHYGEGPREYNSIHSLLVYFYSPGSVVVLAGNKQKRYTYSGEFIEDIQLDSESEGLLRYGLCFYKDKNGDENALYRADQYNEYRILEKRFYEDTTYHFFINSNFNTKLTKRIIGYEDGSIYKNPDVYFPNVAPSGTINKEDMTLLVLFPNDRFIYSYDLNKNFTLIDEINLKPDFFGKNKGLPYGKLPKNSIKYIQQNSSYNKIFSKGDTIITFYRKGLDEDEAFETFEEANENIDKFSNFIQVFINGKKIGKDIKQPVMLKGAYYFHSLNKIIFGKAPNEYDEYNNTQTFYLVKVDLK